VPPQQNNDAANMDPEPELEPEDYEADDNDDETVFPANDSDEEDQAVFDEELIEEAPPDPPPRRGTRERRPNPRFRGDEWVNYLHWRHQPPSRDVAFFSTLDWDDPVSSDELNHFQSLIDKTADEDGTINEMMPMLF
jgi:hypothetical protein